MADLAKRLWRGGESDIGASLSGEECREILEALRVAHSALSAYADAEATGKRMADSFMGGYVHEGDEEKLAAFRHGMQTTANCVGRVMAGALGRPLLAGAKEE